MAGLWFEEFEEGMVFDHDWTRTLTEADNRWFSLLTMNTQPLHIDAHFAQKTQWKRVLVNSMFTLGCMVGMTVNDTTQGTTIGNLGMEKVKFPHPLFEGDTIHIRTTVLAKRASKSRPGEGVVTFLHECFNQDDVLCGSCERAALMRFRPSGDAA